MDVLAMVALTVFIVVEKLLPPRAHVARIAGVSLLLVAAAMGWRVIA